MPNIQTSIENRAHDMSEPVHTRGQAGRMMQRAPGDMNASKCHRTVSQMLQEKLVVYHE
jgi:hypothetical protein